MARKRPAAPSQNLSIEEALSRAFGHWNAGQADQAEMFCQRVLSAWPGQTDALHLMGVMAHAYGNLDLALQHVRQACQAPRAPAVYFSDLAEMCRQKGLLEEGEQAGRRATALNPDLVGAWNNLGIILQESGKLDESVACLERVVCLQPGNPEAHNNLGNTYKRLNRLDRAEAHYAKALSINPNYAEAHSNLSNLLKENGQMERAAAEARLAIDINPRLADAYINLAGVEISRYRYSEALRWLDALQAFAPAHGGCHNAQAMALKQLDRLDEALDSACRAVALIPENADAHNTLGQVLQELGRFDEAVACYERAAKLPGTAAESAMVNRASLLMEVGRKDEAWEAFDQVLGAYPRSASALSNRVDIKKYSEGDADISRMEALLRPEEGLSFKDQMSLHFALGKAYLDVGDDDRAFRHLDEGNGMKRSTLSYDPDAIDRRVRDTAKTFTTSLLKKFKGAGCDSSLPIFIVGVPRSGTTLVEQILSSHSLIHGAGELSTLPRIVDGLEYPACMARMTGEDLTRLGRDYVARIERMAEDRPHVVDKMPANFLYAGLIHLILPNARIVHCRRDPVDTCLSCYTKLFSAEQAFAYDLTELGRFHRSYQTLTAHWREVLPTNRFIEVDYEAVVDDIDGQARHLIDFLGLPWEEACLRFHENKRAVRTASVNQVRQPIYKTSAGRWKKHARHLGPLLAALGIATDPS